MNKLKHYIKYNFYIIPKYTLIKLVSKKFNILDNYELIKKINCGTSLGRLGDGEFDIVNGKSIKFQKYDEELQLRLKEILLCRDSDFIVGIPKALNSLEDLNDYAKNFWRIWICNNNELLYKNIDLKKMYGDTLLTRPYIDYEDKSNSKDRFNRLKTIWDKKQVLLVEGKESRLGVANDLFDNALKIERILCPTKDAYSKYKEILKYTIKQDKNKLVLIALGPTATVLAYDLCKVGFQAIDIGHIDIEYEWFKQNAKHKVAIKGKYTNEAKQNIVEGIMNEDYKNQIIKVIE